MRSVGLSTGGRYSNGGRASYAATAHNAEQYQQHRHHDSSDRSQFDSLGDTEARGASPIPAQAGVDSCVFTDAETLA